MPRSLTRNLTGLKRRYGEAGRIASKSSLQRIAERRPGRGHEAHTGLSRAPEHSAHRQLYRHQPGRIGGSCLLVPFIDIGLPHVFAGSAPASNGFVACSTFTRVTTCMLTESPSDPLHQRLQQLRYLHYCFDCYRMERTRFRAGLIPLKNSAFHGARKLLFLWVFCRCLSHNWSLSGVRFPSLERGGCSWLRERKGGAVMRLDTVEK